MKKYMMLAACVLAAACMATGCAQAKEQGMEKLISAEELIKRAELSKESYSQKLLEKFIEDYDITAENVECLNIQALLEEYSETENKKTLIFDGLGESSRKEHFTQDVSAIAFYENKGSSSECVYYDLEKNLRYYAEDEYLFSDIEKGEKQEVSDLDALLEKLEAYGLWKLESKEDDYADGGEGSMELAVFYEDASYFHVSIENLSKNAPDGYEKLKELLLS